MTVIESRFLRGPNVHRMEPCFVSLHDLEGHAPARLGPLPDGAVLLREHLPEPWAPDILDAAAVAGLIARLTRAAQAWAGNRVRFCDTLSLSPTSPGHFRLVCDYQHEAVAADALRLALDLVAALLAHQPFELEARLGGLRARVEARTRPPEAQALMQAAREHGIPVMRLDDDERGFALGWGIHHQRYPSEPAFREGGVPSIDALFAARRDGRIPVVAVTGTNGKTTTTQLIAHALRTSGMRTGTTTTQGISIGGSCVQTGDCSGYWSARRVLSDRTVEAAILETARGGILKRGLAFDRCDVGVVLNVSNDHLGLDGIETLQDLAHVKGLVARSARMAAVLNADDDLCVAMRHTLAPDCEPVFFSMDPRNRVLVGHLQAGGAGAFLDDDGWLVWCRAGAREKVVCAAELPVTLSGHARYNTANALAALAALRCISLETAALTQSLRCFVSDAQTNPMRGNQFEVDGVRLIVDYAHNVAAYRALCETARSLLGDRGRLLGVVTSPGDRRREDLHETGQVCGEGFDELVVYEHDPRGRSAGATTQELLRGARRAAPGKRLHGEPRIRQALALGLRAARPGDMVVFTCAGSFDDVVEGVRLACPAAAERIARDVSPLAPCPGAEHAMRATR